MKKTGKIVSIVLSVMMLMQILAITSFAAQAPTNVHWAKDGDPNKFSDAELVFNLVDGIEVYKITLYKDNQKIYTRIGGYSSDTGDFYEDLIDVLEEYGSGSYTATVGTLSGISEDYSEEDDVPTLATSEMSDVLVYNGEAKKEEALVAPTTASAQTTTTNNSNEKAVKKGDTTLRSFPQVVRITDISNNELFEVVEEYTDSQKIGRLWETRRVNTAWKTGPGPNDYSDGSSVIAATANTTLTYYDPYFEEYASAYYDGLNVYDIRDMRFSTDGYTDEFNKLAVFEQIPGNDYINFYDGLIKYYEYGYISTKNWAYDNINNIIYVYDFNKDNKYKVDFISNDGELFIFENTGESDYDYHLTKAFKTKIKKAPIVTVCYNAPMLGILDPNEEHDYTGKIAFDQLPIIENGRTLVPLRAIFEKIGADVEWNGDTQTVTATKGDITISLTINNTTATKNGQNIALDVPAKILNGRTLVPVRFVADCFGVDVQWVQETQTVLLTSK